MLEAKLRQASILKKILNSVRELAKEVNVDCSEDGLSVQSMDTSHVALTAIELRRDAFEPYRCDRDVTIGMNFESLASVLKTANDDDLVTITKLDDSDVLQLQFEAKKNDRVADFEMKLMDIDAEHLGIPESEYDAVVEFSSTEYARIINDLSSFSESLSIEVTKEEIVFSCAGDIGKAKLALKQGSTTGAAADSDAESEEDEDDEDVKPAKKRKTASGSKKTTTSKMTDGASKNAAISVQIEVDQSVRLEFASKYLKNFAKAASLTNKVKLSLKPGIPMLVSFEFEGGHVNFFLAPKFEDDDDDE